jgi:hypothetical protein
MKISGLKPAKLHTKRNYQYPQIEFQKRGGTPPLGLHPQTCGAKNCFLISVENTIYINKKSAKCGFFLKPIS